MEFEEQKIDDLLQEYCTGHMTNKEFLSKLKRARSKKKDLPSNESTPRFCFTCGSKLEEIGLGWIQCKDEECGNVYLPFLDREGNQNLMLQETPIKLKSKI